MGLVKFRVIYVDRRSTTGHATDHKVTRNITKSHSSDSPRSSSDVIMPLVDFSHLPQ